MEFDKTDNVMLSVENRILKDFLELCGSVGKFNLEMCL